MQIFVMKNIFVKKFKVLEEVYNVHTIFPKTIQICQYYIYRKHGIRPRVRLTYNPCKIKHWEHLQLAVISSSLLIFCIMEPFNICFQFPLTLVEYLFHNVFHLIFLLLSKIIIKRTS